MEIFDELGNPVVCVNCKMNDWTVLRSEVGYGTNLRCNNKQHRYCRDGHAGTRYGWHVLDGEKLRRY
jgi:hypothetical protein